MSTFISYSRAHSAFVVRLARDLKSAGFDVWLDQLDIPKGARWDDAIEAAVEKSSTFMIVLSPESIESQNVKDELSYAIDAGKHILPVVIQPCKIPLRLRRFQYVDFTDKPYKDSLADIKHLLGNTQQLGKPAQAKGSLEQEGLAAVVAAPLSAPEAVEEPAAEPREPREEGNPSRRLLVPALLGVVALAAVAAAVVFAGRGNRNVPVPLTDTLTPNPPSSTPTLTSTVAPRLQIIDPSGVTMRLVSAGEFILGSDKGMQDEEPAQTIYLNTFYIDKYEVTNALYRICVKAEACQPPKVDSTANDVDYFNDPAYDNHPVVFVDWNMARTYCEWRGARLPTEAEWEKAARGTDGRMYPWGEEISCDQANYFGCEGDTTSVTRFANGVSPYGLHDMAGNVYEWVSTLYNEYPYDLMDGREELFAPGDRVIRGGSWLSSDSDNEVRASYRQKADPKTVRENLGFRCASSLEDYVSNATLAVITPENASTSIAIATTKRSFRTREPQEVLPPTPQVASGGLTPQPGVTGPIPIIRTTVAPTEPPPTEPSVTEPPTQPPTDPPPTDPPPTDPPPTDPPPTDPPPTDPPPTDPPATDVPTP
jgi:formylglycine-generating enzyme required for sulfatase activity